MAKVRGPLFSQEADGSIGGELVFRGGPGQTRVSRPGRASRQQRQAPTEAQHRRREAYRQYTRGTGGGETHRTEDGQLTLRLGTASNSLFGYYLFSPRFWNGRLCSE